MEHWKDIVHFTGTGSVDLFVEYLQRQGLRDVNADRSSCYVIILIQKFQDYESSRDTVRFIWSALFLTVQTKV